METDFNQIIQMITVSIILMAMNKGNASLQKR
ncbi:hypothetical protein JOC34_003880 [Virgibacillus halotolerans]|nr:hypothetical protein [Virgibacillus halotolerans]